MISAALHTSAPQWNPDFSPQVEDVLAGIGIALTVIAVALAIVSKINIGGRGGMGRRIQIGSIIMLLVVAFFCFMPDTFVILVNAVMRLGTAIWGALSGWVDGLGRSGSSPTGDGGVNIQ